MPPVTQQNLKPANKESIQEIDLSKERLPPPPPKSELIAPTRITVLSSSGSHQESFDDKTTNMGYFTQAWLKSMREVGNFEKVAKSLSNQDVDPDNKIDQNPVVTGSLIENDFLSKEVHGSRHLIIVKGPVNDRDLPNRFSEDVKGVTDFFQEKDFSVINTETFSEFKSALSEVSKNPQNGSVVIYFVGHAEMMKPKDPEGAILASATLPQMNHDSASEGLFVFKGKEMGSTELIHEAKIMYEIRNIITDRSKIEHIVTVFDVCHAGAFDAKQYFQGDKTEIPVRDESRIQRLWR